MIEYYPEIKLWCNSKKCIDGLVIIDAVINFILRYHEELSLTNDKIEEF